MTPSRHFEQRPLDTVSAATESSIGRSLIQEFLSRTSWLLILLVACASPPPPYPTVDPWIGDFGETLPLAEDEQALWEEGRLSLEEHEEVENVVSDESLRDYFGRVLERLDPKLLTQDPSIRVVLFEHTYRNALAWPDGSIAITTSLLVALENEAQLAFLLGHEIAHIRYRHSLIQDRYKKLTPSYVDRMRLSRKLETEADEAGFELLIAAGYASKEASKMLKLIDDSDTVQTSHIRSWDSHADLRVRVFDLNAMGVWNGDQNGRKATEEFQTALDPIRLAAAESEIRDGDLDWAERFVDFHLERWPEDGHAYYLRAEIIRRRPGQGHNSPDVRENYERAVSLAPDDAPAARALGLLLLDSNESTRSHALLNRYLELAPEAIDRKLIERRLRPPPGSP